MLYRSLSNALTFAGFGLLAFAVWHFVVSLDKPGALLDVVPLDVPAIEAGAPASAAVAIRNESRHPVRVVGLGTC